jgi:hypothetical protein
MTDDALNRTAEPIADSRSLKGEPASTGGGLAGLRAFFERWLAPYLPYPHIMSLAPLDTVLRMLLYPSARIPVAYWPRLLFLLLTSTLATVVTLPERCFVALRLRLRPPRMEKDQAPIFVLGYFRSGTTFLQSLLAVDPTLRTPQWAEVLVPQTFSFGWKVWRYLLVPFLPLARLDGVAPVGSALPGEDDFALNNWGLVSIMAGRAVLPHKQGFYNRFHDLDSLKPHELSRWRSYQSGFIAKLTLVAGGRRLVLKSPSHTARVRYLMELFPGAKFVHISRPPHLAFLSNLLLVRTLQRAFALQPPLDEDEQEEIIVREYLATEQHYLADRSMIPAGDLAEVRLQDLIADPIGELKRLYAELGLSFTKGYEQRLANVLSAFANRTVNTYPEPSESQKRRMARLQPLVAAFGHDRPALGAGLQ